MSLQSYTQAFHKIVYKVKKNQNTIDIERKKSYRTILINTYNDIVEYIGTKYQNTNQNNRDRYDQAENQALVALIECLDILNCIHALTVTDNIGQLIDFSNVSEPQELNTNESVRQSDIGQDLTLEEKQSAEESNIESEKEVEENTEKETKRNPEVEPIQENIIPDPILETNSIMADKTIEFLNVCRSILNADYKGDPLELQ